MEEWLDNDYYEIENLQMGYDLTAYVENEEDVAFWHSMFERFAPGTKVSFAYNTRGNLARGKTEVLKAKNRLGPSFVLCIDSDYDRLLDKPYLNPAKNPLAKYILQTYTYSIENYKIHPENLNRLCVEASLSGNAKDVFDFTVFMEQLSRMIFPLLVYVIYFTRQGVPPKILQRKSLHKAFSLGHIQPSDLERQGEKLLEKVERKLSLIKRVLDNKCTPEDLQAIADELSEKFGIYPENAFLYLTGHVIYNEIARILKALTNLLYDKKMESFKVIAARSRADVKERKRLQHKILEYKNRIKGLNPETLLATNHLKCLAYNNCPLMEQLGEDIGRLQKHLPDPIFQAF